MGYIQKTKLSDRLVQLIESATHETISGSKTKKNHYIPVVYQKFFCEKNNRINACRKNESDKELLGINPRTIGFEHHYYPQALKNFFSKEESKWPMVVENLRSNKNSEELLGQILTFLMLQRSRIPAVRDAQEKLVEAAKASVEPKMRSGLDLISNEFVRFIIEAMGDILDGMEITVLHNKTVTTFLTSDNPVIYYHTGVPIDRMPPYIVKSVPVQLLFPIASDLLLVGTKTTQEPSSCYCHLNHETIDQTDTVDWANDLVCRFAYEWVLSKNPGFCHLVEKYADTSPVICPQYTPLPTGITKIRGQWYWGKVTRKDKTETPS